jgi:hypothetical protein
LQAAEVLVKKHYQVNIEKIELIVIVYAVLMYLLVHWRFV